MFWPFVYSVSAILVILFLRELSLLSRLKKNDPQRGLYWFNTIVLAAGTAFILSVALYLDGRKILIESVITPFPGAHFAPHHSIVSGDVFIYTTTSPIDEIESFYRAIAAEHMLPIFVERKAGVVAIAIGESPRVFLTVLDRGRHRELHYSFNGEVNMVNSSTTPQQ